MGRLGIDYDDILRAISKLKKKKLSVTGDNIRFELGTGSKTTISRHLRYWKEQQGKQNHHDTLRRDMIKLVKAMAARLGIKPGDIVNL